MNTPAEWERGNCMHSKQKQVNVQCALVLLALFAVQMVMHLNVDNLLLDDWMFFAPLMQGEHVLAYLMNRWQTWSSRLIIEGILCYLTHSIWVFRVLDSAVMTVMAWGLCRLVQAERRSEMLALSACLVTTIPFGVLRSTGWMATSLNYYWPLTATAIALIPLADSLWKRETGRGLSAVAVACAVFGANQEQMSAVIVISALVLGACCMMRDRRANRTHIAIFAVAMIEMTLHLLCPGNGIRSEKSIAMVNLRDYGQFSLVDKLSCGLTSTATLLFFTYCPMLLSCGAVVVLTIVARRRGAAAYLLTLPVAGMLLLAWRPGVMERIDGVPEWMDFLRCGEFNDYVLQLGPERIGMLSLLTMFKIIIMLGLMALALYLSIGHRPMSLAAVFAFALGFAARMALSFSPTVVESGERTMLPLYGAMMLCSLLCARDCKTDGSRRWPLAAAYAVCAAAAAMNVARSFVLAA
ncbi:MAG: DUF6056 family protein [Candidatus Ventricola sp.]